MKVIPLDESISEGWLMWEGTQRVNVCKEVVDQEFKGWEGADGFGIEDCAGGEGHKSLGDIVRGGGGGHAAGARWGLESSLLVGLIVLDSFCMPIGRSSSSAGAVEGAWDL